MKKLSTKLLLPALFLFTSALVAGGEATGDQQEQAIVEYQSMLEEAERARQDAEIAHQGALRAAEMARETARIGAEMAREKSEQKHQASTEQAQERALQKEELSQAREELSRAHRELREATRIMARAHRDLAGTGRHREIIRHVNLGDRAVIGVVLGKETDEGVEIIGISPDGPAERAGLEQGDILASIRGVDLAGNNEARQSIFEVMSDADDGEEMVVIVYRDGMPREHTVTAEQREPRGWQSVIRIPEIEVIAAVSGEPHVFVERIEIADIDEEALATRVAELTEHLEHYEFEIEKFSDFGGHAMSQADAWFGLPRAHGLELTPINEGLGAYFKTDRGVLVLRAREDNAYQLESGDVILFIDSIAVNSPSDIVRTLRDIEPGRELDIEIMRDRQDRTLSVVVPENRLGYR